jgi:hypothetical protein
MGELALRTLARLGVAHREMGPFRARIGSQKGSLAVEPL